MAEALFEYADRLVAADPEIAKVVLESSKQYTDLDMCGARHSIVCSAIAEDLIHYLLEAGWTPPEVDHG